MNKKETVKFFKEKSEYLYYAVNNLSWWKSYFNNKNIKNVLSGKKENAVVYYNIEDEFISLFNGQFLLQKDGEEWELQVWNQTWNNYNGDADSDYAFVSKSNSISLIMNTLLKMPVEDELNNMAEGYYLSKEEGHI